ncbi:MAG: insulinase family protein [Chitinophagales bacterium]
MLSNWQKNIAVSEQKSYKINGSTQLKHIINKENSVQSSVIIGKHLFNKQNDDYSKFVLLNTIFGGYFGSRLMNNIKKTKD